jgi:hypothetical protein
MRSRIVLVLCVAVLVAACAADAAPSLDPGVVMVPVPTQSPPPAVPPAEVACRLALLAGTLVAHDEVGIAVEGGVGGPQAVVWPHGWVARDVDGVRELLDAEGRVVAREGDFVSAAGGLSPPRDWFAVCGEITFRAAR